MGLSKGTKVEVYSFDAKTFLGVGTYLKPKKIFISGGGSFNTPQFKVGRKTIYGFECWWIKCSEAKKVKNSALLKETKKRIGFIFKKL